MKTQLNCDGDGLSRRDLLKVGGVVALGVVVAAVPGVAKADAASDSSRPPDSQNSKAHGQLIDGTSGTAVLLNNGSFVPLVGFEEGYIPEIGEQVALVDGAAYPILRGVRSAEIKTTDGDVVLEGKRYRSASLALGSGSGVAFLILNKRTGEERCLAVRID